MLWWQSDGWTGTPSHAKLIKCIRNFVKIHYICTREWAARAVVEYCPYIVLAIKGSLTRDFRLSGFFMDQFPPCPWVSHLGLCEFFQKFADIHNFVFTADVVDTSSKLFSGVSDTGNKLSLVSLLLLIKPCPGFSSIQWRQRLNFRR